MAHSGLRSCLQCKREFDFPPSQERKYCSGPCFQKARGVEKWEKVTCENCGRRFDAYIEQKRKHCSAECLQVTVDAKYSTVPCARCGKEFRHRCRGGRKYCSSDCYKEARAEGKRESANCLTCGKEFTFLKSWPHQYCSTTCVGKMTVRNIKHFAPSRHQKTCEQCGKTFEATAKRGPFRFCSMDCNAKWQSVAFAGENNPRWLGGPLPYYGPSWRSARRAVRKRDEVCQRCGKTPEENGRALVVHHKIPFRKFGRERHSEANALSNLIAVCVVCHGIVEHEVFPLSQRGMKGARKPK